MKIKSKSLFRLILTTIIMITSLASSVGVTFVQAGDDQLTISVTPSIKCDGRVDFELSWADGKPPYEVRMQYGDGSIPEILSVMETFLDLNHNYQTQGNFTWTAEVKDSANLSSTASQSLTLEDLSVTLSSIPFPPLFVVGVGEGTVDFTANVTGGAPPYTYAWDLEETGTSDGNKANANYTEVGKYQPQVLVTDECDFTASDTLPVVVADPENACHPTAQKIADGINSIFPDQAEDLYTCDDIYAFFDGDPDGSNLGFGQMWQAYRLAETIELTWEEILDWKLNVGGWGGLLQLDRFADLLEEHDLPELIGLVMSDDYSLGDVRTAVRSTTRYQADFEDALTRIAEGANPGELGQLYKLAQDLEVDPSTIDGYLAGGLTLAELKHMANYADRMGVDLTEIVNTGVKEYKEGLREDKKIEKEEKQANQNEEKNKNNTGEKLAEQFSAEFGDVMNLFNGKCEGDWACVRKALRKQEQTQTQSEGLSDHNLQTASQISSKYGVSEEEVTTYYLGPCSEDWACTRTHFRVEYMNTKETGKPEKTGKPDK